MQNENSNSETPAEQRPYALRGPWLNAGEAAEYLRLGRETFRSRVKAGRVKHFFIGKKYRQLPRFHVDDLDDFIRRGGRGYAS